MRVKQAVVRSFVSFMVLGIIGGGLAACIAGQAPASAPSQPAQEAGRGKDRLTIESVSAAAQIEPGAPAELPDAFLPPGAWSAPPTCRSETLSAETLDRLRADPLGLQQAAGLTHADSAQALLAGSEAQGVLTGLALNVASGRLNRATELDLIGFPEVKTVGDLLDKLEGGVLNGDTPATLIQAGLQVQDGLGIKRAVCARLFVTQFDNPPGQVEWSPTGMQAVSGQASPEARGWVMDGGQVAPDGQQVAFTSLGYESGGPVFMLDIKSGQWTNLIEVMNARLTEGQPPLPAYWWWEVIGWFPNSRRLMIGPAELSAAYVVDLESYAFQIYPLPGGGMGGGGFIDLASDGTSFVFIANEANGGQALTRVDLASGQMNTLLNMAPEEGVLFYPRFSPDGSTLAYLVQKGHPSTGQTYAINLYALQSGAIRTLVEGNLGLTVPAWSPDGQQIAFTRKEPDEPDLVIPEQTPPPMRGNIWVVPAAGGSPQQVTAIAGWARSPAWDYDSQTLAFVNQDGQVGLVDIHQPGRIWLAAQTSPEAPLMTSAFFVP